MQPAPTTSSPRRPNPVNSEERAEVAQYGLRAADDDDDDQRRGEERRAGDGRGGEAGLKGEDERKKRISEYENALLGGEPRRQLNEGPGFKVVKRKGGNGTGNGLQLDEFPNGLSFLSPKILALNPSNLMKTNRDPNTHPLPPPRRLPLRRLHGLQTLLQSRYHTSCLAHRFLAFLPRSRRHCQSPRRRRAITLRTPRLHASHGPRVLAQRIHPAHPSPALSRPRQTRPTRFRLLIALQFRSQQCQRGRNV